MEEKIRSPRKNKAQEPDSSLLVQELANFRDLLTKPLTTKRLNLWIRENEGRKYMAAGTLWGTIRWPKKFGLFQTLIQASAFTIEHRLWQTTETDDQVNPIKRDIIIPTDAPQKWDGPDDERYYQVSFISYMMTGDKSEIIVDFAKNIRWLSESPLAISVYREISPSSIRFEHDQTNKAKVLAPFTVVNKRFFR